MVRTPAIIAAIITLAAAGCLPDMTDYWSAFDMDASADLDADTDADSDTDSDVDTDSDADTDSDSDTDTDTEECSDGDAGDICGDGGDTDLPDWDGGVDAGDDFCGDPQYAIYLSDAGFPFDNTGRPYKGNAVSPEVRITGFTKFT